MFEENNQEKRMNKPLMYAVAGVALLVIAITGSAYAYFSASATNTNAITGKTLDVQLSIASLKKVSKGTGDLIPIYDGTVTGHTTNQLTTAISTTNDCVDKNNYTVCQVYELVINNGGTNATKVDTEVTVNGTTGIKWAKMTGRNALGTVNLTTGTLATGVTLPAKANNVNGSVTQYFVVYLQNTGGDQTGADSGKTVSGTVTVRASTGANIEAAF
ncbi:MAG: hypothetical protein L6V91_09210 [Bacilli bacterium]|nr:MAG: hypothetical protein L6V91_09210 [Bacilli bacterium]